MSDPALTFWPTARMWREAHRQEWLERDHPELPGRCGACGVRVVYRGRWETRDGAAHECRA